MWLLTILEENNVKNDKLLFYDIIELQAFVDKVGLMAYSVQFIRLGTNIP